MVHLKRDEGCGKRYPPQPEDTSHTAGSQHPLSLDVQTQLVFTFSCEIHTLCDYLRAQNLDGNAAMLFDEMMDKGNRRQRKQFTAIGIVEVMYLRKRKHS